MAYHQPLLKVGKYTVELRQKIRADKLKEIKGKLHEFPIETKRFFVAGQRYVFDPTLIHSVFPPNANNGEHEKCASSYCIYPKHIALGKGSPGRQGRTGPGWP